MNKKFISAFLFLLTITLLSGCSDKINNNINTSSVKEPEQNKEKLSTKSKVQVFKQEAPGDFQGNKGQNVPLINGKVEIKSIEINNSSVKFYNTILSNGKNIYFFLVKDKNGILRAAANACQVCYGSKIGFEHTGEFMTCKTCGTKYPLDKIATEKGGCNPGPINPNLKVNNGIITLTEEELIQVSDLF